MEQQEEFLLAEGPAPEFHLPDPNSGLLAEIARVWDVPLGATVNVTLRDHQFPGLRGRLEVARAPDLPFAAVQSLHLRIGAIDFVHRQIESWSLG